MSTWNNLQPPNREISTNTILSIKLNTRSALLKIYTAMISRDRVNIKFKVTHSNIGSGNKYLRRRHKSNSSPTVASQRSWLNKMIDPSSISRHTKTDFSRNSKCRNPKRISTHNRPNKITAISSLIAHRFNCQTNLVQLCKPTKTCSKISILTKQSKRWSWLILRPSLLSNFISQRQASSLWKYPFHQARTLRYLLVVLCPNIYLRRNKTTGWSSRYRLWSERGWKQNLWPLKWCIKESRRDQLAS